MTPQDRTPVPGQTLLEARDVRRSFGGTVALTDASLAVRAGEVLAVLGPSGSGKSTLLHCLAGILRPDAGEVSFRGERLDHLPETLRSRVRRRHFGFVFQHGRLVPELSAAENVALPLRLLGRRRRAALAQAADWLARLGVASVADHRPGELSGGQQQRVAVARALVTTPLVVFADEPTGSVDSVNGELVLEALVEIAREQGSSVVLVTHESRVAAYADRDVVVRDGRVVQCSGVPA